MMIHFACLLILLHPSSSRTNYVQDSDFDDDMRAAELLQQLQGEWTVKQVFMYGNAMPESKIGETTVRITGESLTFNQKIVIVPGSWSFVRFDEELNALEMKKKFPEEVELRRQLVTIKDGNLITGTASDPERPNTVTGKVIKSFEPGKKSILFIWARKQK